MNTLRDIDGKEYEMECAISNAAYSCDIAMKLARGIDSDNPAKAMASVSESIIAIDPDCYDGRAGRECLAAMASTWRNPSDMALIFSSPEQYQPIAES